MKYVCELCGTIYDEQTGDPKRQVRPGTAFASLPEDYECPICGSEKEAFSLVKAPQSIVKHEESGYWRHIKYPKSEPESDR